MRLIQSLIFETQKVSLSRPHPSPSFQKNSYFCRLEIKDTMKYYLLPLGCQMNLSDTERVRTVLNGMGFVETDKEDEATILGIIACSVR